jgi:catechol 2,3-dioxygenase-like lactoylglutathione lyase family enzyme
MRGFADHIDLTVSDSERSRAFYEKVLGFLGYRCSKMDENGYDFDLRTPQGFISVGIVRATGENASRKHDRCSPGLHHLAWASDTREDVDRMYKLLQEIGATILDPPAEYPKYRPGYYAVFFADPDGLKLEYVHNPKELPK